jgi:hypothetical protein
VIGHIPHSIVTCAPEYFQPIGREIAKQVAILANDRDDMVRGAEWRITLR